MPSSLFGTMPNPATIPGRAIIPNQPAANPQPNFQPPANLQQIKGFMSMMQNGMNPQSMLQSLMASNPQMSQIMQLVSQHGGDAKAAFYDLAKQRGVDPNQIINMLK